MPKERRRGPHGPGKEGAAERWPPSAHYSANGLQELGKMEWFLENSTEPYHAIRHNVPRGNDDLYLSIDAMSSSRTRLPWMSGSWRSSVTRSI